LIAVQPAEQLEIMETLGRLTTVMRDLIKAQGFNIGLNLGDVAGAGVPGHLHWHLVPRWAGDHNFMPTLTQTRVIPQSLDALWEMLTTALAARSEGTR
jgi:ATP adenylyltransferase